MSPFCYAFPKEFSVQTDLSIIRSRNYIVYG